MDSDGEVEIPRDEIIILSTWIESDPYWMKRAFDTLIDAVQDEAVGVLDWGSMSFNTIRALHPDTGMELHLFTIGVREIK